MMGYAYQPLFDFCFLQTVKVKSSKPHIVFYLTEGGFHLNRTFASTLKLYTLRLKPFRKKIALMPLRKIF